MLDLKRHPEYAFYCGRTNLIVNVTDLKNSPPIDPVSHNNALAVPVTLLCAGDVLAMEALSLSPRWPTKQIYSDTPALLSMRVEVKYYAAADIGDTRTDRPLIHFKVQVNILLKTTEM